MSRSKFTFALFVLALALAAFSLFGDKGLVELRSMRNAVGGQTDMNRTLREEVRDLKHEVISLQTDPATLEREARKELLLGRPDEVVVLFEATPGAAAASASSASGSAAQGDRPHICTVKGTGECGHE